MLAKQAAETHVTEYADRSVFNLSSIVVLAEAGGKLDAAVRRRPRRPRARAGSRRRAGWPPAARSRSTSSSSPTTARSATSSADFFKRLPARHYVISANGRDGNPESATLEAIAASRADDDFTIHLTNHDGKDDLAARLDAFVAARDAAGRRFGVAFREEGSLGLRIDLGDPP